MVSELKTFDRKGNSGRVPFENNVCAIRTTVRNENNCGLKVWSPFCVELPPCRFGGVDRVHELNQLKWSEIYPKWMFMATKAVRWRFIWMACGEWPGRRNRDNELWWSRAATRALREPPKKKLSREECSPDRVFLYQLEPGTAEYHRPNWVSFPCWFHVLYIISKFKWLCESFHKYLSSAYDYERQSFDHNIHLNCVKKQQTLLNGTERSDLLHVAIHFLIYSNVFLKDQ